MDAPPTVRRSSRLEGQHARQQNAMEIDREEGEGDEKEVYNPNLEPTEEPDPDTLTLDELKKRVRVAVDPFEDQLDIWTNSDLTTHEDGSAVSAPEYSQLRSMMQHIGSRYKPHTIAAVIRHIANLRIALENRRFVYQNWLFVHLVKKTYRKQDLGVMNIQSAVQLLYWEGGAMVGHRQAIWGHWVFVHRILFWAWERDFHHLVALLANLDEKVVWFYGVRDIRVNHEIVRYLIQHAIPYLVDKVQQVRRETAIYQSLQQKPVLIPIPASARPPYSYSVVLSVLLNCFLVQEWMGFISGIGFLQIQKLLWKKFKNKQHKAARKRIWQYNTINSAWRETWRLVSLRWRVFYQRKQREQEEREQERRKQQERREVFSLIRPIKQG